MAEFRLQNWDSKSSVDYNVVSGSSELTGTIRTEPGMDKAVKLMAVACVNDKWFPYSNAVSRMLEQIPTWYSLLVIRSTKVTLAAESLKPTLQQMSPQLWLITWQSGECLG